MVVSFTKSKKHNLSPQLFLKWYL